MDKAIKLAYHGAYAQIESPSGKKITASALKIGTAYLHKNRLFVRIIGNITGNTVQYSDAPMGGVGVCSKQHFATTCPNEATADELEFLLEHYRQYHGFTRP